MFDSSIGKAGMNAVVALVSATLLTSAITVAPTVTRVWGFGMMDENETASSQDNSPAAIFTQNQLNCLKLDDGWWSPIIGPVVVKACGPPATPISSPETTKTQTSTPNSNLQPPSTQTETSTASQSTTEPKVETQPTTETSTTSIPTTQSATSTPPPVVTETKDKEGNSVLTSASIGFTISTIVPEGSIQEQKGLAEGVQQVLVADKNDYDRGLLHGIYSAFRFGEKIERYKEWTPEKINKMIADATKGKSDSYKIGLYRGFSMGSDLVDTFGVAGHTHNQQVNVKESTTNLINSILNLSRK